MDEKTAKAFIHEMIESICPHCNKPFTENEPSWRSKPDRNGISYYKVRCENCRGDFWLDFIHPNPLP